jgi:hypothetical protein
MEDPLKEGNVYSVLCREIAVRTSNKSLLQTHGFRSMAMREEEKTRMENQRCN